MEDVGAFEKMKSEEGKLTFPVLVLLEHIKI